MSNKTRRSTKLTSSENALVERLNKKIIQVARLEKEVQRLNKKIIDYDIIIEKCDQNLKEQKMNNINEIKKTANKQAKELIKKIKKIANTKAKNKPTKLTNPLNTGSSNKSKTRKTTALTDSQELKKRELMQNVFNLYEHNDLLPGK